MKRILFLSFMLFSVSKSYTYTSVYVGWENFISPALPTGSSADSLTFGVLGNTPTRVYFYYNILGQFVITKGSVKGQLGWGIDLAGGIGYRFLNSAHKRSGWDLGIDVFGYLTPYFLNSETSYTETALYYGVGLGLSTLYKINPHIGVGFRTSLKYNIGYNYLTSKQPSTPGIVFTIGSIIAF